MSNPEVMHFKSPDDLDETLADIVAELLNEAIEERGRATLVVSGGKTPIGFFKRLSTAALPWSQVWVTLADERWVDPEEPTSNEQLVRRYLLVGEAAKARFVSLNRSHLSVEEAAAKAEQVLNTFDTFDVVVLGMGEDGHTASLFPESRELKIALDPSTAQSCVYLLPPEAPFYRISMTLPRLLNAAQIMVHFTGDKKKQVFDEALASGDQWRWPIAAVISQQQTPVSVFFTE